MDIMKDIIYKKGDATQPIGDGNKLLIHCCNDEGKWGKGFVVALSRRWKEPERQYRQWARSKKGFKLGRIQFVKVEDDIVVCNMVGQHKTRTVGKVPPIRYGAIAKCLEKIMIAAKKNNASVHACRFGAGLAGGKWGKIEELIIEHLSSHDIQVTVYDL